LIDSKEVLKNLKIFEESNKMTSMDFHSWFQVHDLPKSKEETRASLKGNKKKGLSK